MFFRRDADSLKSRRQKRMEELEELRELQELRKETHLERWDFLALIIAGLTTLLPVAGGIILCYYLLTWFIFC